MVCQNSSCKTNLCFICGKEAFPDSGHWDRGNECSRWNHPDDPNAQFDRERDVDEDLALAAYLSRVQAAVRERERELGMPVVEERGGEDENDGPPPLDLLYDDIGREEYYGNIEEIVGTMNDVSALPDLTGMTDAQQLEAENGMANELESSTLGRLMLQHQHELDLMIELAEHYIREAEDEDLAIPAWATPAIQMMTALRSNVELYVYRIRLRTSFQAFDDRHDSLERAYGEHQAAIFRHFRRFYEILVPYSNVADIRMLAATAVLEGDGTEDEVVRGMVAAVTAEFRARREGMQFENAVEALMMLARARPE